LEGVDLIHNELIKEQLRNSFFEFVKYFWDVVVTEDPVYNWHIPYLCEELEKVNKLVIARKPKAYDLIINIPPGTTKSTICTIMYPVWCWITDPTQRFITASHSLSLSREHAVKSRDIIRDHRFTTLFPECELKKDKDNKSNYENINGGQRFSTAVKSSPIGMHAHQHIVDDPVTAKGVLSKLLRDDGNEFMTQTLSTRKVDKKSLASSLVNLLNTFLAVTGSSTIC